MSYPAPDYSGVASFVGNLNATNVTPVPVEVGTKVHTVSIVRSGGVAVTAETIQLQGSHDGSNWFSLGQTTATTGVDSITATAAVKLLRLQVTAVTATTSHNIAATIMSVG